MNTLTTLHEITRLLNKAQGLLAMVVADQPRPSPGKPDRPNYTKKAELEIWNAWEKLKGAGEFGAKKARQIAKGESQPKGWIDSSYSSILSRWAREGYLVKVSGGVGPVPAIYKIPS
jgi:hypothetical protein